MLSDMTSLIWSTDGKVYTSSGDKLHVNQRRLIKSTPIENAHEILSEIFTILHLTGAAVGTFPWGGGFPYDVKNKEIKFPHPSHWRTIF